MLTYKQNVSFLLQIFIVIVLFITGISYSLCLITDVLNFAILSLLFVLVVIIMYLILISQSIIYPKTYLLILCIVLHSSFLIGFILFNGTDNLLWSQDAYDQHLPNSLDFMKMLNGDINFEIIDLNSPFKKVYVSNMFIGIFFYFFGVDPVVSSFAMMIIKLITIILIYKSALNIFKNKHIAFSSVLLYIFNPNILFYTLVYYKEFFVQMLVSLFIYSLSLNKPKYSISLLVIGVLSMERFYLGPIFFITFAIFLYYKYKPNIIFTLFIFILPVFTIFIYFLIHYFGTANPFDIYNLFKEFQSAYSTDSATTENINFIVDFFRILFTPFINVYKINNFYDYSSLLIFGGLFHQILILFYLYGLYIYRNNKLILIHISFLLFLILFSFLGPFNGRVRDSFYPILVIWSSAGIYYLFRVRFNEK